MGELKIQNNFQWLEELKDTGVVHVDNVVSADTLKKWNVKLYQHFSKLAHESRSYATIEDRWEMGIFQELFNSSMCSLISSIMVDPVLLCCHIYETERSEKSHVFSDSFNGWHRDVNELPGLNSKDLNYVSLFIHLSDVESNSGAFEIVPGSFIGPLQESMSATQVTGPIGTTYFWNRTLFHRASPNRSDVRRRMLKISFQHNHLQNEHIASQPFKRVYEKLSKVSEDSFLRFMMGEKHTLSPLAVVPDAFSNYDVSFSPFEKNSKVKVGIFNWIKGVWWYLKRGRKMFGP